MNPDKAIKILSDSANAGMTTFNQDYKDAQRLGIEALVRHQNKASLTYAGMLAPLPSETTPKPLWALGFNTGDDESP